MGQTNPVAVLDKAVAILRAVADEPATLAELVERTGLPRATAHRLAVALEGHRLVRRTAAGAWSPGPALGELGRAGTDLADVAGRHLAILRDVTGESAQFYVREGTTRVCLAAAERSSGLRDTVPVGARLPMTAGSAAHALLAFAPAEEVTPLLPAATFTARTLIDVRRRGWAHSIAEREAGVASLSAPVREPGGGVLGAVSISGPVERLGRRPAPEVVTAVLEAAAAISRAAR
ncbi:helix-turn-helix domain-containing protein [Modestobacter sp. I12A-02628]|uniref:IclR family transcriptional regulator n=1 Tax=Goekera deserti TaxID=2497753 RepID=A0A7K3WGW4_9ACTN|nr:IclR family transcriptional regulator [Goekera deserti]MPQ97316.1 helix-turn-helix domain-containing protein [Goekera deserti]NDI50173.1 helix-turn-helix domain-containing protein [Goekera deserti]NEL55741.1 IclR family transcriptional regulator [Goekera deserti]